MAHPEALVDVIVAAYDDASTIARAVESALADEAVARVIVIDDCSGDDTVARARACDDGSRRLEVLELPRNGGPARARNVALEMSSSQWVAVLDADDYFEPGRVAHLLRYAADVDFIADNIVQIKPDPDGTLKRTLLLSSESIPRRLSLGDFLHGNISRPGFARRELGFLKPLIRRRFLEDHRLRYDESLRLGEDFALYATALVCGARFLIVPLQGYVALERSNSLSARHTKTDLERLCAFDLALGAGGGLTSAEAALLERHFRSIDARVQWLNVIEAVKARDLAAFIQPFFRSVDVSTFITARLAEQTVLRARRLFGRGQSAQS